MIGSLKGRISEKKPTRILLDVNGIGFQVNISLQTFDHIPDRGEEAIIHTYLYLRENALELYGFYNETEKEMFELLISVSGIGPRLAQSILSGITAEELSTALRNSDLNRLIRIHGIGRKTGEKLIFDLKDKIISAGSEFTSGKEYQVKNDALNALVNLGFNLKTAEKTILSIIEKNPEISVEELIKNALSSLAG